MLKMRLARHGSKKRPFYHIVVADIRTPRDGRFIEKVGTYNPMVEKTDPSRIVIKTERAQYWLGQGVQPTDRVARFLGEAGLVEKPKYNESPKKSAPKAKAVERIKEKEEKANAAKEAEEAAKAEAEEAAKAAAEAPAEEAPAEEAAAPAEDKKPAE